MAKQEPQNGNPQYLFEIYTKSGKRVFCTQQESCIPPKDVRKQMRDTGYEIRVNKESWKG